MNPHCPTPFCNGRGRLVRHTPEHDDFVCQRCDTAFYIEPGYTHDSVCPGCGEDLIGMTDIAHYRHTGEYRGRILCPCCEYDRPAVEGHPVDDEIMETAAERYWTGGQA